MNEILLKRICHLIGMSYGISKEAVWEIYCREGSLDKTLEIVAKNRS